MRRRVELPSSRNEVATKRAGGEGKPFAVVAKTVKGWGSPTMQGGAWHGKPAEGDAMKRALGELDERRVELTSALVSSDQFTIQPPSEMPERETRTASGERGVDLNGDGLPDVTTTRPETTISSGTSQGAITITQPVYTGGRVTSQIAASEADVLAGREALRQVEAAVLLATVQAYVDVRRDQERLRISQENVAVLQRQLEESTARFEVGEITRTDVAQSEARLAAARASLASSQAFLAISRALPSGWSCGSGSNRRRG